MSGAVVEGIDHTKVAAWFSVHVPSSTPPFEFELIAGGHSNLT